METPNQLRATEKVREEGPSPSTVSLGWKFYVPFREKGEFCVLYAGSIYLVVLLKCSQKANSEAIDQLLSGCLESYSGVPAGQWAGEEKVKYIHSSTDWICFRDILLDFLQIPKIQARLIM